ncbi:hypothetical protein GQ44DRAFT_267810 [Phaeosphaeriaceae sp. PMI808]|nr:hypothetical protein GQ44DRAFT_267810 [Phaeosphaeriaceae sp. PMI808]
MKNFEYKINNTLFVISQSLVSVVSHNRWVDITISLPQLHAQTTPLQSDSTFPHFSAHPSSLFHVQFRPQFHTTRSIWPHNHVNLQIISSLFATSNTHPYHN